MYYTIGEGTSKTKDMADENLLWKRTMPPVNLTRYNLTSFAITLNELTPGLKVDSTSIIPIVFYDSFVSCMYIN